MAQSGYTPIQLYRTTTGAAVPSAANLLPGELGFNIADTDMALYAENASGTVTRIMNNPAGLKYPTADGSANQAIITNGSGVLSFVDMSGGISYVVKTGNYTTQSGEGVLADTSGGAFTVTLPATPAAGDQCVVADPTGDWGTNNLTVGRNGSTIAGSASDLVCDISGVSVQLVYDGSTWNVYAQIGGNGGTVVTEDGAQTLTNKTITFADNTLTGVASTSTSQTLTNKTITNLINDGSITEEVYALGTSGSLALEPDNGTIQTCALTGNPTFTDALSSGQSIVLMLTNGASYTVTWPTITWVTSDGDSAPTLTAADTLVFWKISSTLYGAYVGSYV